MIFAHIDSVFWCFVITHVIIIATCIVNKNNHKAVEVDFGPKEYHLKDVIIYPMKALALVLECRKIFYMFFPKVKVKLPCCSGASHESCLVTTRHTVMVLGLLCSLCWISGKWTVTLLFGVITKILHWHAYRVPESCLLQAFYRAWPHLTGSALLSCRLREAGLRGREGSLSWAVRHGPVPSCCCLKYFL